MLLNGDLVDPLSALVHRSRAVDIGKELTEKVNSTLTNETKSVIEQLKEIIPKHLFVIAVQASIGKQIVARET